VVPETRNQLDEQISADAVVPTRRRSAASGSLRRQQWYARFRLRTNILPSERHIPANGDRRLTSNFARSRADTFISSAGSASFGISCGM
jgi:hypothetical protein